MSEARNYEYVVYPQPHVQGTGVKIPVRRGKVWDLTDAKAEAKKRPGSGIYSVSKGRFVGWITPNGRFQRFGR